MSWEELAPLRKRLERLQKQRRLTWESLERDFLFSWILAAIGSQQELRGSLVFKGGACLKKCYFGDYRFSEDLDFSSTETAPRHSDLEAAFVKVCREAERLLRPVGEVRLELTRYVEREPHPHGQEAFLIRGQMPWHSRPHTKVLVEVSPEEPMLWPLEQRPLLHEYGEIVVGQLATYGLAEIVAEKLRAILQQMERGASRGWVRPRGRDYYNLWRILKAHPDLLNLAEFGQLLHRKCQVKNVDFSGPASFFPEEMMVAVARTWKSWMEPLVSELPDWELLLADLRPLVTRLLDDS